MKRKRLLIVGCGDVMQRALPWLTGRFRVYALARRPEQAMTLRALGVIPILGDLDHLDSLRRLAGLADWILHSTPPPAEGRGDPRTTRLLAALYRGASVPRRVVYISTSGVYGDCRGELIDETRRCAPESARGQRRVAAEQTLRRWLGRRGGRSMILRAPGIYAADRLPIDRLRAGTPALQASADSYSNHVHADDLARLAGLALFRGRAGRVYHACDDAHWRMGDWFDAVADATGLPRPVRLPAAAVQAQVSPTLWSFMRESRRLSNLRAKQELRWRLCYSTPMVLLQTLRR